ncbi:PREDICTED: cytochrome P450 6B1-like [Papilio polytes]|uniref:cytochrome P450 6B1-like n=1 Tax=Papilio polytes TaxID=76194 RepID=UPI000675BC79|nr:PREDICTED: cytochrome P450 6B1-like [Papilio polytes]
MRKEVKEVMARHNGNMAYEVLQELTYMEMVIQETLRLYPPFPSIQRMCTKDYTIRGTDIIVEKGTIVLFPTLGIQRDEQVLFVCLLCNCKNVKSIFILILFISGKRFAMIQMKCCLVKVLQHVKITPVPRGKDTERTEPFEADPRSPLTLHPLDSRVRLTLL